MTNVLAIPNTLDGALPLVVLTEKTPNVAVAIGGRLSDLGYTVYLAENPETLAYLEKVIADHGHSHVRCIGYGGES